MYGARKQEAPNWTESTSRDPSVGDPGLTCLIVIAHFHGIAADAEQLRHQSGLGELTGRFSENDLLLAAKSLGLKTRSMQLKAERLEKTPLPALLLDRDHRHFIVARVSEDGNALIQEGDATGPRIITQSEVISRSDGRALLFTSRASLAGDLMRFDFSWFIPALVKYRRFLLEVLLISAVLQLLGLVSPLMFQVVMDKVLVNQAFSTLNVVCVALLKSSVAETLLTG